MTTNIWPEFLERMQSDQFRDFTLKCKDQKFEVHKNIAAAHSPTLRVAISPDSKFAETVSNTYEFEDEDPDTVGRMVSFMYTGDYQVELNKGDEPESQTTTAPQATNVFGSNIQAPSRAETLTYRETLMCHVRVNEMADYLQIESLSQVATAKIVKILQNKWSVDAFILVAENLRRTMAIQGLQQGLAPLLAQHIGALVQDQRFFELDIVDSFAGDALKQCAVRIKTLETSSAETKLKLAQSGCQRCRGGGGVFGGR